ncbi:MAG: sodium-dependent transporter [Myxococcota bacterium]|nr:sodium-dependent transporter [Myxococcota bacterium]
MSQAPREEWGSRLGFVLAAVGSAVGLGHIWRVSYLSADHGGAALVVLYLAITVVIALPILLAELVVGRGSGRSPIAALRHFGGRAWAPLGGLCVCAGFVILAYYSVIAGWTLRFTVEAISHGFAEGAATRWSEIRTGWPAVGWHLAFMGITIWIVLGGIRAGIERAALLLMPLLFAVVCGIAIYAATLTGSGAGYSYYLDIDLNQIWSLEVFAAAASQAFFSLSLGMGAMLTYASYLSRESRLEEESLLISVSDFGVAFVSGLMVFPLIFALGLSAEVGESTLGALFVTLPTAFAEMQATGRVIGVLFFGALAVAALTSAISLLEVVVASAIDQLAWSRRRAVWIAGTLAAAIGILPALDLGALEWMDKLAGNVLLIAGGLALAVFVGWVMRDPISELRPGGESPPWLLAWRWLLRIPVPLVLAAVLYQALRGLF